MNSPRLYSCQNCASVCEVDANQPGQPVEIGKKRLECHVNPPKVEMIPTQGGIAKVTFWPDVAPTAWCSRHSL